MAGQGGKGARTSPRSGAEVELELEAQRQVNADILTSLEVVPPIHGRTRGRTPTLAPTRAQRASARAARPCADF